jgi:hypothetical protein
MPCCCLLAHAGVPPGAGGPPDRLVRSGSRNHTALLGLMLTYLLTSAADSPCHVFTCCWYPQAESFPQGRVVTLRVRWVEPSNASGACR